MRFVESFYLSLILIVSLLPAYSIQAKDIEEILVETSLLPVPVNQVTFGISVIDSEQAMRSNRLYVSDLLTGAPNTNFSSGASRGRFFQIRGTGERSQFIDPIASSVGYVIDGVDFSTAANIGALYDIERVEVLRGPQGTTFGSSASAGLINIKSSEATGVFSAKINSGVGAIDGNDGSIDTYYTGFMVNGAISDSANARLSMYKEESDGFANNEYLDRDETNNIDETLVRAKVAFERDPSARADLTLLYSNVDNGYDAFTLDNVRNTISDQPGHDKQETIAFSALTTLTMDDGATFINETALSVDDINYAYDEDWSNSTLCDPPTSCPFGDYSSFDQYERDRNLLTTDFRYVSVENDGWQYTVGVYLNNQSIDLDRTYTFAADFTNSYDTVSTAAYGELSRELSDGLKISAGMRIENFSADYEDTLGETIDLDETLWGGHLAVSGELSSEVTMFGRLSRGFKAAGVNANGAANLIDRFLSYDTETLYNLETGVNLHAADDRYRGQVTLFYQERHDAQIKQSQVIPVAGTSCPCTFEDYISNAVETQYYGIEVENSYRINDFMAIKIALGYLKAEFEDYTRITPDGDFELTENLNGRAIAQAPEYTFSVGTTINLTDQFTLWLNAEGRDKFFFSNRHEAQSDAYELINATLSYSQDAWSVWIWGTNLLDEDYYVRGFESFGNDPRNGYTTEPYYQYGDPAQYGIAAEFWFD